jgi:hypothetical protein
MNTQHINTRFLFRLSFISKLFYYHFYIGFFLFPGCNTYKFTYFPRQSWLLRKVWKLKINWVCTLSLITCTTLPKKCSSSFSCRMGRQTTSTGTNSVGGQSP